MNKWLALVKILAPVVLSVVKPELAPIAGKITDAIMDAEQIKGATGLAKLQYVQGIGEDAADVINAAQGKVTIDKNHLHLSIEDGVSAVVAATNVVVKRPPFTLDKK